MKKRGVLACLSALWIRESFQNQVRPFVFHTLTAGSYPKRIELRCFDKCVIFKAANVFLFVLFVHE